jgi:gliding motility-associated-like protein
MHSFRLYILFYASRKALGIVAFLTLAGLVGNNLFAQDFEFARLSGTPINTTGWNLQGNARVGNSPGSAGNSEIILTDPINTQSGAVFYNTPINLSQCKKWVAEFEYRINDGTIADGIAFCYLDVPPSGFVSGGGIGIPATANGLKVVIDTWLNCGSDAIPKLQIRWGTGYNECNGQPTRSNNDGQMGFLRSTSFNKCRIEYFEGNIKVFVNGVEYLTAFQTFNFTGYFGFTASTGGNNDRQSIKNVRIFTEMPPSEAADAGSEVGFCPDGTAMLGTSPTAGHSYKWTPTTGLSNPAISNPSISLPNTGTNHVRQLYFVETAFTDRPGCASRDSVWVNVWANPKPNLNNDTGCLPGSSIFFQNTTQYDPQPLTSLLWGWNFGNPASGSLNTSSAVNPTHFYNQTGPFTVSLSARTDKGCVGSFQKTIEPLLPKPTAEFNFKHSTCLADSALFTSTAAAPQNSGDSIVQWEWFFGDNQTGSGKTVAHKYAAPGTFEVKHVSITSRGCVSDTVKKTIIVHPNALASFTLAGPFCKNRNVNVVNTSTTATGSIVRWQWDMGNGQVFDRNNGAPFTYAYPTVGTFMVKLIVTLATGCQSDTSRKTITVGYVPIPGFVLPDVCLNDASAEFTNTTTIADGSLAQTTWLWNYGDPNANAGNPNTGTQVIGRHQYTATGIYPVKLLATSSMGCIDSLTQNLTVNGNKPLAVFNFVNAGNQCSNLPVSIQNKSTVNFGNITRVIIFWNSGVNNNDTTQDDNPSFDKIYQKLYNRFASPALRSTVIRFRVFSGTVCVNETTRTFNLYAAPDVKITTIPGICLDATPRLITQGFDAGNNAGTGIYSGVGVLPNGLFTPAQTGAGTFSLQYKFTTVQGCTDSATAPITVWPQPIANFGFSTINCIETPIVFTDQSIANANRLKTRNWNFGDGTTQIRTDANPFNKVFANTQNYTILLTVVTDSGCNSLPFSRNIVVNPKPVVNFDLPGAVCLPEGKAVFTNRSTVSGTGGTPLGFAWHFGVAGATSTLENPTFFYSAAGPFTVQLKATSAKGCADSISKVLNTIYPQAMANWTATPPEVCLGQVIQFTDVSNPLNNTITAWSWVFGDGGSGDQKNPAHLFSNPGTFKVTMFYTTGVGCYSDTFSKNVIVHPYPTVNAGPDQFLLQGGQVTLRATVTGSSNYAYSWTPGTWLSSSTILQPVSRAERDITYTLTVTGAGGCSESDDVFVKLLLKLVIPNAFSPNSDGINDTWIIRYLDSYPGATVQVFDRYGKRILMSTGYNTPWDGNMGGKPIPAGVYYYVVDPKNGLDIIKGSVTLLR